MLRLLAIQRAICRPVSCSSSTGVIIRKMASEIKSEGSKPNVAATRSDGPRLIKMVKTIIPPLDYSKHKGEDGRLATIGGCKEYTGAPYFAALTALKVGCDLSHVFCTKDAAPVIKSYSPELIVHPILDSEDFIEDMSTSWLSKMHGLIIGPGLGSDELLHRHVKEIIIHARGLNIPMVIDADGVRMLCKNPEAIQDYRRVILTPNIVEFKHLYLAVIGNKSDGKDVQSDVMNLSRSLGNVTICLKGASDIITDGINVLICDLSGSPRRCGGQGDILSGAMGTFNFWSHKFCDAKTEQDQGPLVSTYGPTLCAAYAACLLTKRCATLAFLRNQRSTTTSDLQLEIHQAFSKLFGE
ncbi:ATP-dependent (S)-NAD(P)H-hydrate dehydratase-like [Amphiura filiformis]|uniref:ATP-dependent (S)-NAD(P)H-hydrate dehydratase-like n=1 Tax=Amphiura filiformis TaxID=82378 RepID=UPI003B2122B7